MVLCLACNQQARDNRGTNDTLPTDGTELNDTLPIGPDTSLPFNKTPAPQGLYRVVLPDGEHTVSFYKGQRYRLEEKVGRGEPARTEGEWVPSGGYLWLYKQGVAVGKYRWQGDTLVYLLRGKEYLLEKLPWAMDNDVWRAKGKAGAEFFGIGNEPFWNIEIDEQKGIAFHLSEWAAPARFPPARPVVAGDSIQYNTANDSATLRVVIYHRFCSDGMSDFIYDQQVKVVYNTTVYQGCGLLFK
ncbi:MAG TPA: hypothetical protein VGE66_08640 [Chitinophagaceae bacterium]